MKLYLAHMTKKIKYDDLALKWRVLKEQAGVYMIFLGKSVIYVGKSVNLYERLTNHLSDSESNYSLKGMLNGSNTFFQVIYEDDEREQSRLENILYDYYYHPICNNQRPDKFI